MPKYDITKCITVDKQTIGMLDEIKSITGDKHSPSIRIAVAEYYKSKQCGWIEQADESVRTSCKIWFPKEIRDYCVCCPNCGKEVVLVDTFYKEEETEMPEGPPNVIIKEHKTKPEDCTSVSEQCGRIEQPNSNVKTSRGKQYRYNVADVCTSCPGWGKHAAFVDTHYIGCDHDYKKHGFDLHYTCSKCNHIL